LKRQKKINKTKNISAHNTESVSYKHTKIMNNIIHSYVRTKNNNKYKKNKKK